MISKMTEPCILWWDIQIPTEKSLQHRNDFNYQRTLHPLWGHSNPNWKTQIIIEMITKMTDPYILCWDIQVSNERSLHLSLGHLKSNLKKQFRIKMIWKMTETYIICGDTQIPTEKDSSALTWFQRSHSFTSFEGRFRSQLRKTVKYCNDYKDGRTLHSLRGHSNSDWQNLTSFVGTFKFNWKKQFSTQMTSKVTETYIDFGDTQIPTEKTVQYWNDFKDHRTLHPLWDIQIPTENNSLLLKS